MLRPLSHQPSGHHLPPLPTPPTQPGRSDRRRAIRQALFSALQEACHNTKDGRFPCSSASDTHHALSVSCFSLTDPPARLLAHNRPAALTSPPCCCLTLRIAPLLITSSPFVHSDRAVSQYRSLQYDDSCTIPASRSSIGPPRSTITMPSCPSFFLAPQPHIYCIHAQYVIHAFGSMFHVSVASYPC